MQRQGDLLIVEVADIPERAVPAKDRVLAEGEATGHRHELDGGEVYEAKGQVYFRVPENSHVTLTHPEHNPLVFTPGEYKVVRQREYQPGTWRHVAD